MRNVGSEFLSAAAVLAVPLGIAAAFPFGALGFSPSRDARPRSAPSASIVFLDEADVTRAMRAARSVPRAEDGERAYIDLFFRELPDDRSRPMAAVGSRHRSPVPPVVESGIPPFLPSRRADAPVRISAEGEKDALPFPREELLKLN